VCVCIYGEVVMQKFVLYFITAIQDAV
jgi:hypothetical protein